MLIITRGNMKIITEDDNNPAEEERGSGRSSDPKLCTAFMQMEGHLCS